MRTRLWKELTNLDPRLRAVFEDFLFFLWQGDELEVTSIYRTPSEDRDLKASGIHVTVPHRSMDIRVVNWDSAQEYADKVNARWEYDSRRPHLKVALGAPHGTGPHIHLQVHPGTKRRA